MIIFFFDFKSISVINFNLIFYIINIKNDLRLVLKLKFNSFYYFNIFFQIKNVFFLCLKFFL